jgi:hypothetical protein
MLLQGVVQAPDLFMLRLISSSAVSGTWGEPKGVGARLVPKTKNNNKY